MNRSSPIRRKLLAWIDSNDLPWMPPWPLRRTARERQVLALRRFARRLLREELVAAQGWPRTWVQAAAWPAIATLKTFLHLREKSAPAGLSVWCSDFARIWWQQIGHNLRIGDQIDYRLDPIARRHLVRSFISCHEQKILLARAALRASGYPGLDEKRQLDRFCKEHGLPHPATLMQGEGDRLTLETPWPDADLVFKPTNLYEGRGVEILRFDAVLRVWATPAGERLTAETLPAFANARLCGGPWLVQPRLVNHPAWRELTPGPLSTLRIVTGRVPPDGRLVIVGVQARFALHNPCVDNVSAGGMSSFVDQETGRMNVGMSWHGTPAEHVRHPVTGGRIQGELVHNWPALRALALRAHEAAGGWSSIGWDIADTSLGPMIIEANLQWGAISFRPQGHLPFPEVMQTAFGADYPHASP